MSYLFLILSLICFYSVAPAHTEEVLGSLGGLARAVGQLESLLNTHNLHKRSAEYGHREDVNKEDGSGQRSSSFRVWMPYTRHHYDMGPISQCSCPQLDACMQLSSRIRRSWVHRPLGFLQQRHAQSTQDPVFDGGLGQMRWRHSGLPVQTICCSSVCQHNSSLP